VEGSQAIEAIAERSPEPSLHARVSLGGAGNLGLDRLEGPEANRRQTLCDFAQTS
jgi:hypothetical protein